MTTSTHMHRFYAIAIAAVLALAAAGCSTPGRSSATKANDAVTALQERLTTGEQQLDATVASLSDLVNKPQSDLQPQYKKFLDNMDKLESQIKKGRSERAAMTSQADAYFAKWEDETQKLQNQEIKQTAVSRREAMKTSFDKIGGEIKAAKPQFDMLMRDLQETKQALDFDLTPGGINAIKPVVAKIQDEAAAVKTHIATIRGELGQVSRELAATAPSTQ
jgi:chromosome segregation ATPase